MEFDGTSEMKVDRSRFVGLVKTNFTSLKEIDEIFYEIVKEHKKANHLTFAYRAKIDGAQHIKYNDNGEPRGTAGLPILSAIEHTNIENILVVVVRYYGGKKLGSSKLLRTYRKTANEALKEIKE